jgi:hypothetical protein
VGWGWGGHCGHQGGCGHQGVREVGWWVGVVIGGWCLVREWEQGGGGIWAEDVSGGCVQ